MQVTLEIPDTLAAQLVAAGQDPARAALEALAINTYASGTLSEAQVRRLLGFETRMEVHQFLAAHNVPLRYTEAHLQLDIEASDQLHAQHRLTNAA